jgi:hypothetical protein
MEQELRTMIKPYVKYVWMMRATRPTIPATCQPIFDENMGLSEFLEVPMDTEKQTTKAQRNLSISVAKIGQLRVSDTMFVKGPLSFNSPREHRGLQKQLQDSLQRTWGLINFKNISNIYDTYGIVMKAYRYTPNDTAEKLLTGTWL